MPSTKTPRKSRTSPDVNYNPVFPGGNNGQRKDNARARVAYGDNGIKERVDADRAYAESTYSESKHGER